MRNIEKLKERLNVIKSSSTKDLAEYIEYELDPEEYRYLLVKLYTYEINELEKEKYDRGIITQEERDKIENFIGKEVLK